MTAALDHLPTTDVDPFAPDVLTDPLGFHEELRAAGPLVRLTRYDVLALGRYTDVRAALVDWQSFRSGAGVGMLNFHTEPPWRPPSLLLEADPPHHDAPRRVLGKVLGPRALRVLRERWAADAETLVECAERLADLRRWATDYVQGPISSCGTCQPPTAS